MIVQNGFELFRTVDITPTSKMSSSNATMSSCIEFANRVIPHRSPKDRREYAEALLQCRIQPAYQISTPMGDYPCDCYPLMEWDTKGWTTVKRKVHVKKVWTNEELDEEADLNNWDYVEHYGRATYANNGPTYEHNGALFDIGSRF